MSCPPWARGLKYYVVGPAVYTGVVPPVGTWIEIIIPINVMIHGGRAPRGHVD